MSDHVLAFRWGEGLVAYRKEDTAVVNGQLYLRIGAEPAPVVFAVAGDKSGWIDIKEVKT